MEFQDYLFSQRYLSAKEYMSLIGQQLKTSVSSLAVDEQGFLKVPAKREESFQPIISKHPIGEVLRHTPLAKLVFERAGVQELEELVEKWHQWHLDHLEPIGHYATTNRCGSNLFREAIAKKRVGVFAVNSGRKSGALIQNGDNVVIPEASSAFYVAMAAAAKCENLTVITSNAILFSEYLNNPCVARAFRNFYFMGGRADLDPRGEVAEHAGVFGPDAQLAYNRAIEENPGATVVVMPTSGLLPEQGPFATQGEVRALKLSIIKDALQHGVRELIFISDHSKHLKSKISKYGTQILPNNQWRELIEENRARVSLVTTPPATLRDAIVSHRPDTIHPYLRKPLGELYPEFKFDSVDYEYNRAANSLADLFHDEKSSLTFHEVCDAGPQRDAIPV